MLELAEQLALGDGAVVHAWEEAVIDPFLHRLGQHDDALVALEELLEVWPPAPIMAPMGGPHLADRRGGVSGMGDGVPKIKFHVAYLTL